MEDNSSNLRELLWRRKLSGAERAGFSGQAALDLESRLTAALSNIYDVPVPSNFTSWVLVAVDLEEARVVRARHWTLNWRLLWPRVAAVAAILFFAGVGYQRYETHSHRAALAKNVLLLARSQPLPSVEVLENLDAIQRMSLPARADGELLAALQ